MIDTHVINNAFSLEVSLRFWQMYLGVCTYEHNLLQLAVIGIAIIYKMYVYLNA